MDVMTAPCRRAVNIVLYVTLLTLSAVTCSKLDIDRNELRTKLESDLRQYFSDVRFPINQSSTDYKEEARRYIHSVYNSVAEQNDQFTLHIQSGDEWTILDVNADLRNYIGVLKGSTFNSSEDRVVLLGAHYDTVPTTPGVDDNGSGISALLGALRSLKGCKPKHTIMLVAFDLEEYVTDEYFNIGSQRFVNGFLLPTMLPTAESGIFQGAYILDTIMNYDPRPNTQVIAPLEQAAVGIPHFQSLLDKVKAKNNSGDFLALIGRQTVEDNLYNTFVSHFKLESSDGGEHQYYMDLPFTSWDDLQAPGLGDFLRSDHKIFWSKSTADLPNGQNDLPAVFLTDTAEFRRSCTEDAPGTEGLVGLCQMCYHSPCDSPGRTIDDDNLDFLAATTEALAASLAELAQCKFSSGASSSLPRLWQQIVTGTVMLAIVYRHRH